MATNGHDLLFPAPEVSPEVRAHIDMIEAAAKTSLDAARRVLDMVDGFRQQFPDDNAVKENPTKARILLFDQLHRDRTKNERNPEGLPAQIMWGRDMKLMKAIIERYGVEETDAMIREFFTNSGDFVQRHTGFTIPIFQSSISRIISRRAMVSATHGITQRTEQNRDQSRAAVAMIRRTAGR